MMKSLAIIGAGPVGLEAALRAAALGFRTTVLEAGDREGANVRAWGHVRCFSPWSMNASDLGRRAARDAGRPLSVDEAACPTGAEFAETYLSPVAKALADRVRLLFGTRVVAVAREGARKSDFLGSPERAARPFRILAVRDGTREEIHRADLLIDASGVYGTPNHAGQGGIPAPGERAAASLGLVEYRIPDVLGRDRERYAGKRVFLVGGGHSAQTTAIALAALAGEAKATRVAWAFRSSRTPPFEGIANDPLPERNAMVEGGNRLATSPPPGWTVHAGAEIEALRPRVPGNAAGGLAITLATGSGPVEVLADVAVANVGFGPDNSLYRELQVHECYASRGPMKLAALLLGDASADCLGQTSHGADALASPEPNFFLLGNNSYGRNSRFLLRVGYEQVADVFRTLGAAGA
jgi:cation diffusion facilitator CzcD-associated flavoprotein CzcO